MKFRNTLRMPQAILRFIVTRSEDCSEYNVPTLGIKAPTDEKTKQTSNTAS